jgi:hypothetical protein
METKDIFLLVLVIAVAGASLYRKYKQKNAGGNNATGQDTTSKFGSGSKDDDYEPYSGNRK